MRENSLRQIVPGVSVSEAGEATVDPALADVLFDLAIKLEEATKLPVDVEHVLAAVVLVSRRSEIDPNTELSADDPSLVTALIPHVESVFAEFGGKVGRDD